jgi:hypothetical protein
MFTKAILGLSLPLRAHWHHDNSEHRLGSERAKPRRLSIMANRLAAGAGGRFAANSIVHTESYTLCEGVHRRASATLLVIFR